jgi:hypothetical protein
VQYYFWFILVYVTCTCEITALWADASNYHERKTRTIRHLELAVSDFLGSRIKVNQLGGVDDEAFEYFV